MFSRFAVAPKKLPPFTDFWPSKHKFQLRTFGNTQYGDCTRASQATGAMRMEWLEQGRTPQVTDEEVVRVFLDMCERLYNGDASGAYIMDALNCWRNSEYTFRDSTGHPFMIDAYIKVHPSDQQELRQAIFTAGAHGVLIGINLPNAFENSSHEPSGIFLKRNLRLEIGVQARLEVTQCGPEITTKRGSACAHLGPP